MKGDKLLIEDHHLKAAEQIANFLRSKIREAQHRFVITIAGESGSGKSEIASALSQLLSHAQVGNAIFQQDDYFVYPPKTNSAMREKDITHVGLAEVRLELLDSHLGQFLQGKASIQKPLVLFDEDTITQETVSFEGIKLVIVEGTYTTVLSNAHNRIFINRAYLDTRETRKRRARERQDELLERILAVEHGIISAHKMRADIVVTRDYEVVRNDGSTR